MSRKFTLIAALATIVAIGISPCAAQKKKADRFSITYEKYTLANGLEVILHEDHSDPIVAVATIMHVGSNREKPGKTGFAHFFEHMAFNDSENAPVGANRKLIPEWGGERNGGTWTDGTIYYEVVPKDAFDKILWIDSDRLGYMIKTVTEEALAREIQVVKNEKRQNVDNVPYGFTDEIQRKNLYPANHPYHWTVIGQLEDLQAATLEDVKEFYSQFYGPNNATLVIAGDIDIAETKAKVERWFGEIKKGPEVLPIGPKPVRLSQTKSLYFEDNFARLPELQIVFPTVENYHPDSYALQILGQLLAGNRNSPLYKTIVENRKLAPDISTYQAGFELAGEFIFDVRANAGISLQEVKDAISEGLQLFEKEGISDKELERIRAKIETDSYSSVESILDKARRLGVDNEFIGDPGYISKAAEFTRKVTKQDVMRVYDKYVKNKHCIMTSVVPKGQLSLIVKGAEPATVFQEQVVANVEHEQVSQGEEAKFEKTVTKHDRSEPAFLAPPMFKMPQIWQSSIGNGLKIYGIENREVPLVSFDITIPGGHSLDPIDKSGVASLMAGMLMQGTKNKTPQQLEEAIDMLGANLTVYATNEEIRLQGRCLERNFEPTFALAKEILLQPRWDEIEFNRLKQALETRLKGQESNAAAIANVNFPKLMYGPSHILGYPVSGTLESTAGISLDDLKKFYQANISPSGAAIHIAGAIDRKTAETSIKTLQTEWTPKTVVIPTYPVRQQPGGKVYFIDVPGAKQSVLYIGKLALSGSDPESARLGFANEILGGGSSGRLFQMLRIEKGFTYGAYSNVRKQKEISPFIVTTSVRANATGQSLDIIRKMLSDYGLTFGKNEAEISKNKIVKGSTLLYEGLNDKLGLLREISKFNKSVKFLEEDQQQLMKMSEQDFRSMIGKYLQEKDMVYLVVGDKATQFEEVKKFANGDVTLLDINGNPAPQQ